MAFQAVPLSVMAPLAITKGRRIEDHPILWLNALRTGPKDIRHVFGFEGDAFPSTQSKL